MFGCLHRNEEEEEQKKVENGEEQVQKVVWEWDMKAEEEKKYGKKRYMRSERMRKNWGKRKKIMRRSRCRMREYWRNRR